MVGENEGNGQVMSSYGSYRITISGLGYLAFCDDGRARKTPDSLCSTQIVGQGAICACSGDLTAVSRIGMEKAAWSSRLAATSC